MENQTIVEVLSKHSFTLSDLRDSVYTTLDEKSTRQQQLTMDNITCTISFTKPEYVEMKNPDNYYYFIMELGDSDG